MPLPLLEEVVVMSFSEQIRGGSESGGNCSGDRLDQIVDVTLIFNLRKFAKLPSQHLTHTGTLRFACQPFT